MPNIVELSLIEYTSLHFLKYFDNLTQLQEVYRTHYLVCYYLPCILGTLKVEPLILTLLKMKRSQEIQEKLSGYTLHEA